MPPTVSIAPALLHAFGIDSESSYRLRADRQRLCFTEASTVCCARPPPLAASARRWSRGIRACATPTRSSMLRWSGPARGFLAPRASYPVSGSASGRRTTPNGCCTMFAAARPVSSSSTSIRPIAPRARVRAASVRLSRPGVAPTFKSSDYIGMLRTLLPEIAAARAGTIGASVGHCPHLSLLMQLGGEQRSPGFMSFAELIALGNAPKRQGSSRSAAAHRSR